MNRNPVRVNWMQACAIAVIAVVLMPAAVCQTITVEVTNNQPAGGFSVTPLWFALHDGTFDVFDDGGLASPGVEAIAELGNPTALGVEFAGSGASGVAEVVFSAGVPPFTPGETDSLTINVGDPTANRYFSYAAMFVPSNDFFVGNDDPMAVEVFDATGDFLGPVTIEVYGRDVWDAGTEIEDILNGGAFVVGVDATISPAENDVIRMAFGSPGGDAYFASLVGVETVVGPITDPFASDELLATITIVPEPGSLTLLSAVLLLALRRR